MTRAVRLTALLGALSATSTATVGSAIAAGSAGPDRHVELAMTAQPSIFGALEPAPLLGELDLDLHENGDVTGFFRNESDRVPIVVTGSIDGRRLELNVGLTAGSLDIDGTLDSAAAVLSGSAILRGTRYAVTAGACGEGAARSILCQ